MALARPVAAVHAVGARAVRTSARCSPPTGPTRRRPPRPSAPCCARPAVSSIRTRAVGVAVAEKEPRDPAVPMVVLSAPRIAAKFPDAVEAACGCGRRFPNGSPISIERPERVTSLPADQVGGRAPYPGRPAALRRKEPPHERRVTRLPSGIMRDHRSDAASGIGLARRLGQFRQPRRSGRTSTASRIFLEHMAFKGTSAAHRAPDRRRRSRRSAATSTRRPRSRAPPITRACSRPTCRSRSMSLPTSSPSPSFDPRRAAARAERHRAGDRRRGRHPGRSYFRASPGHRVSRSAARPLDPRARPTTVRSFDRAKLCDYLARHYRAPDIVVAAAGAIDHRAVVAEVGAALRELQRSRGGRRRSRRTSVGGTHVEKRELEQVHIALAHGRGIAERPRALQPAGLQQHPRRWNVLAAVPGGAGEARPLLLDLFVPCPLQRRWACSASMPAPTPPTARS